jgi:dUTP pyrophosphatase
MKLKIKQLTKTSRIPTMSYTTQEAGIDFYSDSNATISSKSNKIINTGISIEIPDSTFIISSYNPSGRVISPMEVPVKFYMKLYSRSGLSAKYGIEVGAGVIDSSYRGEIMIVLYNHSDKDYEVLRGDKIAQGVLYMVPCYDIELVSTLSETERGSNGFGSSGN